MGSSSSFYEDTSTNDNPNTNPNSKNLALTLALTLNPTYPINPTTISHKLLLVNYSSYILTFRSGASLC